MKVTLILGFILASTSLNVVAKEELCQKQSNAAFALKKMIDEGTIEVSKDEVDKISKAISLVEVGEHCKARKIIISLSNE
ncbi:hypothetical protein [Vibrio crassostreae]|uniref:hypothetical protein n=1 Tax=Vibrio crassostreae TaxID=246167 RepID=UPI001B301F26|nr:hypothetical protein [Vibrio crassostreae]